MSDGVRLRQLVFASRARADISVLQRVLGLGVPFADPGVAEFGLVNGVFALGDQFLEVVVPDQPGTSAGRFIDRSGGVGGYMAIFQTPDLTAVRGRADVAGLRRVWNIDLPDISASHLHPGDMEAAIVSVDEARPAASWRWGGPDWRSQSRPGALLGAEVQCPDPQRTASRWASLLGVPLTEKIAGAHYTVRLDRGAIDFTRGSRAALTTFYLEHPQAQACLIRAQEAGLACTEHSFTVAGVKVSFLPD